MGSDGYDSLIDALKGEKPVDFNSSMITLFSLGHTTRKIVSKVASFFG